MLGDLWDGFTSVIGWALFVTGVGVVVLGAVFATHEQKRDDLELGGHTLDPIECTRDDTHWALSSSSAPGWTLRLTSHEHTRGMIAELVAPHATAALDPVVCRKLVLHEGEIELDCETAAGNVYGKLPLEQCHR